MNAEVNRKITNFEVTAQTFISYTFLGYLGSCIILRVLNMGTCTGWLLVLSWNYIFKLKFILLS